MIGHYREPIYPSASLAMSLRPVLLQTDQVHTQSVWVAHNLSLLFQESQHNIFPFP